MPRIFTVFLILAAAVFQVDDLFPVSRLQETCLQLQHNPCELDMKLSGKITVDRRSVLGFSSTPMLILFKQEVLRFFISFCTLSAFLAFSTYGELHTLFLGNCNCSWHWVNKFLSNLNELHGRFFSQQNFQIISFPNSMLIVVLNI